MSAVLRYLPLLLLAVAWEAASRLGIVSSGTLPPLSQVAVAWLDYNAERNRARDHVAATTDALAEHAQMVAQTADLVLADMQGPKLRVGTFAAGPVMLVPGSPFRFDLSNAPGDVSASA